MIGKEEIKQFPFVDNIFYIEQSKKYTPFPSQKQLKLVNELSKIVDTDQYTKVNSISMH